MKRDRPRHNVVVFTRTAKLYKEYIMAYQEFEGTINIVPHLTMVDKLNRLGKDPVMRYVHNNLCKDFAGQDGFDPDLPQPGLVINNTGVRANLYSIQIYKFKRFALSDPEQISSICTFVYTFPN